MGIPDIKVFGMIAMAKETQRHDCRGACRMRSGTTIEIVLDLYQNDY